MPAAVQQLIALRDITSSYLDDLGYLLHRGAQYEFCAALAAIDKFPSEKGGVDTLGSMLLRVCGFNHQGLAIISKKQIQTQIGGASASVYPDTAVLDAVSTKLTFLAVSEYKARMFEKEPEAQGAAYVVCAAAEAQDSLGTIVPDPTSIFLMTIKHTRVALYRALVPSAAVQAFKTDGWWHMG
eukprot:TRINITY_DN11259_c0_g1_i1.p1 TRINITY_DN11259_c0_g1~~TRINITY_DN11259_c0_g1_i1.p1  ORF type:complete len:183 (-),score=31.61 TRINITY_DN11259_c0_g1_i1:246-794(-)